MKYFKLVLLISMPLLIGAVFIPQGPVTILSFESKTLDGGPVYNKIDLKTEGQKDIWLMKQSHRGVHLPDKEWDELMIIVDKSKVPREVSYHQLKDGKETEYRASCYLCHSNGPRLIRRSHEHPVNLIDRAKIALWNFKIKSYGPLKTMDDKRARETPLLYYGRMENDVLKVKTCTYCHQSDSFWGRGELKRQHLGTIKHLVDAGEMPPWPFKLSDEEKSELEGFMKGF